MSKIYRCSDCRAIITVKRKRGLPPWKLKCPICGAILEEQ